MTTLNNILWGYMNNQFYKNNSQFVPDQKDKIILVISGMKSQICRNVNENENKN